MTEYITYDIMRLDGTHL